MASYDLVDIKNNNNFQNCMKWTHFFRQLILWGIHLCFLLKYLDSKTIYWWVFLHIKIKSPNLIHLYNLQGIIFLTLEFMGCLLTMLLKGLALKHFQFKLMAKKTQIIHVIKWHETWNWNLLFILPVKKNAPVSPILQVILSGSMSFN